MRTPLATLDAYLEAIEDGVAVMDQETVALLRAQTARLGRLTEDVTAVSRAEEGQLDLHPIVLSADQVIDRAAAAARSMTWSAESTIGCRPRCPSSARATAVTYAVGRR